MSETALKAPADGFVSSFPDTRFDAMLVVSFGGPEGPDDVLPFLENVTRGRNIPRERLVEVAQHYFFGGVSPINAQLRELLAAHHTELDAPARAAGLLGQRNWHPMLADTSGRWPTTASARLGLVTSAYRVLLGLPSVPRESTHCAAEVGAARAPDRPCAFLESSGLYRDDDVKTGEPRCPDPAVAKRIVFTAHSIPIAMANTGATRAAPRGLPASRGYGRRAAVATRLPEPQRPAPAAVARARRLRSFSPAARRRRRGVYVVVVPIGFVADHMEVKYDLDVEARDTAAELGLNLIRAASAGTHPRFVAMIRELIEERLAGSTGPACRRPLRRKP